MTSRAPANPLRPLARARALSMRVAFVRALRSSLAQHDVSHEMLAECCGRTRQRVTEWCDEHRGDDGPVPSVLDELAFPAAVRADLDAWRATMRLCVVLPAQPDELTHRERLALLSEKLTAPVCVYSASLADDVVDRHESAAVAESLRGVIDVSVPAYLALRRAV